MSTKSSVRQRRSWSKTEKAALVSRALQIIDQGGTWTTASETLGVWPSSLMRWAEKAAVPTGSKTSFKAIEVIDAPMASGIRVETPDGFVVTGLDVDAVALLLGVLRCSD